MLIPEDDYPLHQQPVPIGHVMNGHPNAYDRFWFNGYDENLFFAVALGLYPNRGVIDGAFSVVRDGVQRSVFASDALAGRPTTVGPVRIEIVEPLRVNRVVIDAPDEGLAADLIYTRRTVAFEEQRQTMHDGPRIFMDVTRATQMGTWSGWVETPEGRVELRDGTYGTKDRSWGVRPIGEPLPGAPGVRAPQLCFWWAPLNFKDRAFHFTTFDAPDGRPLIRSAVVLPLDGAGEPQLFDGTLRPTPLAGTRRCATASIDIGADTITLEPLGVFHMRGAGYGHPEFGHGRWHGGLVIGAETLRTDEVDPLDYRHLHVQQVVRAHSGDEIGYGVLESLIVGPYEPLGLSGLLDGSVLVN